MKTDSAKALAALSAAYALAMFHRTSFSDLAPLVGARGGLGDAGLSAIGSAFFWAYLAFQIPAGLLADALGSRKVAMLGCVAMALGGALFAVGPGLTSMVLGRALAACGAVSVFMALIGFCSSYGEHSSAALGRGMLIGNLGGALSGAPLAAVLTTGDWQASWLGLSAAACAMAAAAWFWAPKDAPKSSAAKALALAIPQLRDSLSHVDVYLAAGALAGLGGAFHAFAGFGAHLLAERAGMNSMGAGWMVSAMAAGFAVGAAYWGKVADDTARRLSAAVTAPFGAVIAWGWLAAFPPSSPVLLCMALAACGWASASLSLAYPMLGELCRGKPQGAIKAAANCGIPLGAAAAQLVQGFLDARSCALPCLALSVLGAACFIAMAIRMRGAAVAEAAAPSASAAPAA